MTTYLKGTVAREFLPWFFHGSPRQVYWAEISRPKKDFDCYDLREVIRVFDESPLRDSRLLL
jgi:hypothetical protein